MKILTGGIGVDLKRLKINRCYSEYRATTEMIPDAFYNGDFLY